MLVAGLALSIISIFLSLGHINLLHEYHRYNVSEENKKRYGLSIGLSLLIGGVGMTISGLISIIVNNEAIMGYMMIVAYVPLFISIILAFIIIKKFNKTII